MKRKLYEGKTTKYNELNSKFKERTIFGNANS